MIYVSTVPEQTDMDRLVVEDATIAIDVAANRSPTIRNSTLRNFSQIGVRIVATTATTTVSNNTIEGTRTETGIDITDASPIISGNTIQNLLTGIHLKASANPSITGNTITGNTWGLWLEGSEFASTAAPNPVITGNTISGNSGVAPTNLQSQVYCWTYGANLCMSGYTNVANINVTGNYWGTTDPNAIRASIVNAGIRRITDAAGTSQGVHGGNVNFSGFLNAAGGTAVDSLVWSSTGFSQVSQNKFLLKPETAPGDSVTIQFTPAQALTSVSVQIYQENDDSRSTLIDTPCTYSSAAANVQKSCIWDGRDSANEIVPWEAYRYVISGTPTDGGPLMVLDPPRRENYGSGPIAVAGDTAHGCFSATPFSNCVGDSAVVFDVTVDLAKNQYFNFVYSVKKIYNRPYAYPVRADIRVKPIGSTGPSTPTGLKFPILPSFSDATAHVVTGMWDGRDHEGNLITGENTLGFGVPQPLRPNSVIVENAASRIASVSADPYLIYHSYDQTTTLGIQLTATAKVKVHILPPGELAIVNAVETISLNGGNALNAGPHTFSWNGQPAGEDSSRRSAVTDGVYSFAVEAQHPTNPAHASIFRGVIQVRQ